MYNTGENKNSRVDSRPKGDSGDEFIIRANGLKRSFVTGDATLEVLKGIDLEVKRGEMISVMGESGAGKSTLLHILGGLDRSTDGSLEVCEHDFAKMSDDQMASFRNRNIGFVFQFHHLLSDFTALENVMMPLLIQGVNQTEARIKASNLLERVHLKDRANHRPGKLSGGEQQRVAVLRALAADPQIVLADEPSGNLDEKTADGLHDFMVDLKQALNTTFVIATHNRDLAARADVSYELTGGKVVPATGGIQ